ncbi:hypothetical protein CCACVL1_24718 [Corchorus capsularis]|uniref:Uncharacterized protein n=1 Tax=Corchorus capsularis TaxID=210143 RepID=A0A1R3GNH8_COCAP|nr:hypothetical protein CCACVL1_24718 [Corchorus capsularis]
MAHNLVNHIESTVVNVEKKMVRLQKNLARIPDLDLGHSVQAPIVIP